MTRERQIFAVTLLGSVVNLALVIFKFAAGILGRSAAMVADAVHSLSDFATDVVVLLFVKISNKPADERHKYGHGRYETLASLIIGISLLAIGVSLCVSGVQKIITVAQGGTLEVPGWIAFIAAILSIVSKEAMYRITLSVGKKVDSDAVIANAWHHRSDALSSIGTALGIGGALLLGKKWAVLDPIAAVIVSVMIAVAAIKLIVEAIGDLTDRSLPAEVERKILDIASQDTELSDIHKLRTRSIGNAYSIDMHVRMNGNVSLNYAHQHTVELERRLKAEYGDKTIVNVHIEPVKVNGEYEKCEC